MRKKYVLRKNQKEHVVQTRITGEIQPLVSMPPPATKPKTRTTQATQTNLTSEMIGKIAEYTLRYIERESWAEAERVAAASEISIFR